MVLRTLRVDDGGVVVREQSVRSQRSFQEHMATLYQNIDNLVYAAETANHYEAELLVYDYKEYRNAISENAFKGLPSGS
jgi:hypothetical protein